MDDPAQAVAYARADFAQVNQAFVDRFCATFPDFSAVIRRLGLKNDVQLAERILDRAGVALVPGSAFGAEGHLRFSYATTKENLDAALDRLEKLLAAA